MPTSVGCWQGKRGRPKYNCKHFRAAACENPGWDWIVYTAQRRGGCVLSLIQNSLSKLIQLIPPLPRMLSWGSTQGGQSNQSAWDGNNPLFRVKWRPQALLLPEVWHWRPHVAGSGTALGRTQTSVQRDSLLGSWVLN